MEVKKQWVFLALIVVASVAITVYFGTSQSEVATLTTTIYPQPAEIGYVTIEVNSSVPLHSIFVVLPDREPILERQEGDRYYFKYYVSPYDDIGLKQVNVYAIDINGHEITDDTALYIDYFVGGAIYNDIIFYSKYWVPDLKVVEFVQKDMNIFFESKQGLENDGDSVQGFFNIVLEIAEKGTNVTIFDATTDGKEWIQCMDSNSTIVPLETCYTALDKRPSVILRYPDYYTTQVLVTNTTIDIQPKHGEVEKVAKAMEELLDTYFIM